MEREDEGERQQHASATCLLRQRAVAAPLCVCVRSLTFVPEQLDRPLVCLCRLCVCECVGVVLHARRATDIAQAQDGNARHRDTRRRRKWSDREDLVHKPPVQGQAVVSARYSVRWSCCC